MTPSRDPYIVGPRSATADTSALAKFREALERRNDAVIVSAKPGGPMVVQLMKEAKEELSRDFGDELIIEPDAPLRL